MSVYAAANNPFASEPEPEAAAALQTTAATTEGGQTAPGAAEAQQQQRPRGAGLVDAEIYEPDAAADHIVWAFFRIGQFWLKPAFVANPVSCAMEGGGTANVVIDVGNANAVTLANEGALNDGGDLTPAAFEYSLITPDDTLPRFTVTVGGPNRDLLVVWKTHRPFYQKWRDNVQVLAVPI